MECINCTAIDECDTIMDSVGLPKDLYDTLLKTKLRKKSSVQVYPRMKGYSAVLFILTEF
jgi:hypothetical protein